jgi:solute carrier family 50 protein (sugar transporter)
MMCDNLLEKRPLGLPPWIARIERAFALMGVALLVLELMDQSGKEFVFSMLGLFGACYLFQSPLEGHLKIIRDGYVGEFPRGNALTSVFNALVWLTYLFIVGLWTPFVTNIICLAVNLAYACIYAGCDTGRRVRAALLIAGTFGLYLMVLLVAMVLVPFIESQGLRVPHFPNQSSTTSSLGFIALIANVMMYAAPLSEAGTVIRTKSAESMPTDITVGVLAMSSAWLMFGCLKMDWPIIVPNLCGVLVGAMQLGLIVVYGKPVKTEMVPDLLGSWKDVSVHEHLLDETFLGA